MEGTNKRNFTQEQTSGMKTILETLDADPKAQECLKLYKLLPESEKTTMLRSMDAFLQGFAEGRNAATA